MEKTAINSAYLFRELSARLKKSPELQQRIVAHVREVSGHQTLPAFVNNGAKEEEKCEVLSECLKAILSNDFSKLKGGVAKGQAPAPPSAPTETVTATKVKSFKVGVKEKGSDEKWVSNSLRFLTADEAKAYGSDLFGRWMGISAYEVQESEDEPIHKWVDGKVIYPEEHKDVPKLEPKVELTTPTTETATTPQDEPAPPITITPPPAPEPATEPTPAQVGVDPRLVAVMEALKGLVPAAPASTEQLEQRMHAIVLHHLLNERAKFEEYCKGFLSVAVPRLIKEQIQPLIDEHVLAAKFELVKAIEAGHEKSWKRLTSAIAEVV